MPGTRTLAPLLVLAAGTILGGCPPPAFDYDARTAPRIWVKHSPLNPSPGQEIVFTAVAEPGGAAIDEITVQALLPGGRGDQACGFTPCVLRATPGGAGLGLYSARLRLAGGATRATGSYLFHVGQPAGDQPVALRVPFDLLEGDQVRDVLLVAHDASYPGGHLALRPDAEDLLYDGLLADPAYRWRDRQLGFWLARYEGATSDYDSGLATRCGQEPWLGQPAATAAAAASAAAFADVLAVIHRQDFRDCAGLGVVTAGAGTKRNLSADGRDPRVFHHELGHAFAGLSDEYNEDTASRTARGGGAPDPLTCDCCDPDGGGTPVVVDVPGGGGLADDGGAAGGVTTGDTVPTVSGGTTAGGGLVDGGTDGIGVGGPGLGECLPSQPPCAGFVKPAHCYPAPPACPPLGSACAHPNIFPDQASCAAAAVEIAAHPGVENPQPAADCRLLCSNAPDTDTPCPCTTDPAIEWWILDRRHPVGASLDDDVMGLLTHPVEHHGPACQRCLETTFCLDWELARGRTRAQAEAHCLDPQEGSG
ncbi:MAG: hypothetical protein R3325_07405 [Thermoanaerobaculia bacterium]|nr:hypothetical protein [Thermoanaerobaculia bacterium]